MPESQSAQPATTGGKPSGGMFSHRYGPLPLWMWLALILGALLIVTEIRSKKAASSATTAQPSSTVPNNSSGVVVVDTDIMPYPTDDDDDKKQPPPIHGGKPPVKLPGPPPKPTPQPGPKPPVNTRPPSGGNTPKPQRTQKVGHWPNWDGSLWGIAQHYYGNGADWPKIYNANKSVIGSNPNMIKPDMVLVIP